MPYLARELGPEGLKNPQRSRAKPDILDMAQIVYVFCCLWTFLEFYVYGLGTICTNGSRLLLVDAGDSLTELPHLTLNTQSFVIFRRKNCIGTVGKESDWSEILCAAEEEPSYGFNIVV